MLLSPSVMTVPPLPQPQGPRPERHREVKAGRLPRTGACASGIAVAGDAGSVPSRRICGRTTQGIPEPSHCGVVGRDGNFFPAPAIHPSAFRSHGDGGPFATHLLYEFGEFDGGTRGRTPPGVW